LDLKMPFVNGVGLLYRLRRDPMNQDLPAAVITRVLRRVRADRRTLLMLVVAQTASAYHENLIGTCALGANGSVRTPRAITQFKSVAGNSDHTGLL
jgi:hypothetical protein